MLRDSTLQMAPGTMLARAWKGSKLGKVSADVYKAPCLSGCRLCRPCTTRKDGPEKQAARGALMCIGGEPGHVHEDHLSML